MSRSAGNRVTLPCEPADIPAVADFSCSYSASFLAARDNATNNR